MIEIQTADGPETREQVEARLEHKHRGQIERQESVYRVNGRG